MNPDNLCINEWPIFQPFSGVDTVDYNLYPDKEYQLKWLRQFLETKAKFEDKDASAVSDQEVEKLYAESNKFALVSDLGLIDCRKIFGYIYIKCITSLYIYYYCEAFVFYICI